MHVIGGDSVHVTPTSGVCVTTWTDRPWWTIEDASRLLRVHTDTLYDACASGDFPCDRFGGSDGRRFIRIPAEALRMTVKPETQTRTYHLEDADQLALDLDPACLIPVRRYRNGDLKEPWDYEKALWMRRKRLEPFEM